MSAVFPLIYSFENLLNVSELKVYMKCQNRCFKNHWISIRDIYTITNIERKSNEKYSTHSVY
jgi:hypothetical protein